MRQTNVHDISQPLHYLIRDRARDIATQATAETQAPPAALPLHADVYRVAVWSDASIQRHPCRTRHQYS